MKKIFKNIRPLDYLWLCVMTGLIVVMVWLELKIPKYMEDISPLIAQGASKKIVRLGLEMLLCAAASSMTMLAVGFINSRFAAGFAMRLRQSVFCSVESFSLEQIKKFSTASLITRTTNDVGQIQMVLSMGLQIIIRAPITAIWALSDISSAHYAYSLATGVAVIVLVLAIVISVVLAFPKFKKMQTLTDNVNRVTRENLEGVRVVRAYNAEDYEKDKFEKTNDDLTRTNIFASRAMGIMDAMMGFVMSGLTLAIYFIGANIISKMGNEFQRQIAFGQTLAFASMATQVVMSFMLLTMIFIMLPRAIVSFRRVAEVLNTKPNIQNGSFDGQTEQQGTVEFRNVTFKYPDAEEDVLTSVDFKVNRGESVAFIGSTGSGKSTLINLIPRFYDATDGQILVDGVDIKDYDLTALRNKIGYISQKAIMFSGSVKSNLQFGQNGQPEADDEKLNAALDLACADFVQKMPNGLDSFIAQGGTNVSGGQKQRLSIARGLARDPEILIFDDTFSALDYKTDKKLRSGLKKKLGNTTKLIVAQRIGTIKDCDQIIVLNEGKVVGKGKHSELLENCAIYKEIALSQLSEEELK